jgi:hypothetical protein
MESNTNQNLLIQIEEISFGATKCKLDFTKLKDVKDDIKEVSEFLGITYDQTILFSCLVELSLQKTVTLEHLARHLRCSVLKVINLINEIEVLANMKYVQKRIKSDSKKYSYNDIGFTVPHNVIESLRTMDKSKLITPIHFSLPKFLEQVTDIINVREENAMPTQILLEQVDFMISNNKKHLFIQFIIDNIKQTVNICIVFELAFLRLKRRFSYNIDSGLFISHIG